MAERHALWDYEWGTQSDFLLDLAKGLSVNNNPSVDFDKYLPPHRFTPTTSGGDTGTVTQTTPMSPPGVSAPLSPPPVTQPMPVRQNKPQEFHRAPLYTSKSCIVAKNNATSNMCGCSGSFFWELIPADNISFFRGAMPDSVDHCISSIEMYRTFSEAFWDAYNNCITHPGTDLSIFNRDYCIAVYQMHQRVECPRHFTRFTLTSVKDFLLYNEALRAHPIIGAFCKCNVTEPVNPAQIPYNICFNCLQCTLELKAISPIGITQHFSFECNFKVKFLAALQRGVQNRSVYFLAQSLFEPKNSMTREISGKSAYLSFWTIKGRHYTEMGKHCTNCSLCMMCAHTGNGFVPFLCSTCSRKKLLQN